MQTLSLLKILIAFCVEKKLGHRVFDYLLRIRYKHQILSKLSRKSDFLFVNPQLKAILFKSDFTSQNHSHKPIRSLRNLHHYSTKSIKYHFIILSNSLHVFFMYRKNIFLLLPFKKYTFCVHLFYRFCDLKCSKTSTHKMYSTNKLLCDLETTPSYSPALIALVNVGKKCI